MFEDFRQAFDDPASWHAMVVHFPVVLGSLAFLPILAALAFRLKHKSLLWVAVSMLLMMAVATYVAIEAGEAADKNLRVPDITSAEEQAVKKHEELAEGGWMWPLIPVGLLAVALVPWSTQKRWIQMSAASLAMVSSLGVAGWIALTAHAGGQIVYIYGIGPPERGTKIPVSEMKSQKMPSPFEDRVKDD
jgi:uncharacterized membrane protein